MTNDRERSFGPDRRSFLKFSAAGAALPFFGMGSEAAAEAPSSHAPAPAHKELPALPRPDDLASDRLVHGYNDYFNPPQTQNELGSVAMVKSVSAITSISLPPFACCGIPDIPFSPGTLVTCELFLNDRILASYPSRHGIGTVAYTWYPDRVVRETDAEGLRIRTETFMPPRRNMVAEWISVTNSGTTSRTFRLGFDLRAGVTATAGKPWFVNPPGEADNRLTSVPDAGCLLFEARQSRAASAQGVMLASGKAGQVRQNRMVTFDLSLGPGETATLHYLNVIAADGPTALQEYRQHQARFQALRDKTAAACQARWQAAFTAGNSEFSGHLPTLVTRDASLWKLYYNAAATLLFCRRQSPASAYGTTYVTLSRVIPTMSFPWDTMLTSLGLALLDPLPLRSLVEAWMTADMHQHLATDYLTGQGQGPWYAVNDMAILRCADHYLRVTGDFAWLDKSIDGRTAMDRLLDHALYWKTLVKGPAGLADYGVMNNELEVVSTYIHAVAAMNAGNVYGMRFVAALLERRGDHGRALQLRGEAMQLARRINQLLYVQGKGWWRAMQPDGSSFEVRHCYDFLAVLDTMYDDLSAAQKEEMAGYFWRQLYTPVWMHALSPEDSDATWNPRSDHSWLGAYGAWPPMSAKGLYKIAPSARVSAWVKQLSRAANQGPFGQAHMVEAVFPPVHGGAFKSPLDMPYGNDWSCISGACFGDLVIDSIFGADLTLDHGVQVQSRLQDFDPKSELHGLRHQNRLYRVTSQGAHPA